VANRRRRVYRVTPTGARALRAERRDWQSLVSCVEAVLTPLPTAATGSAL
jgi:DNA-binding PadR family transcriptional regulator